MSVEIYKDSVFINVASAARADVVANIPGREGRAIAINMIDVEGDDADCTLDFYLESRRTNVAVAAAAGQSVVYVGSTSGLAASDRVAVQKRDGNLQYTTIFSVGESSITLGANLANALQADPDRPDEIVELEKKAAISVGNGSKQIYGDGIMRIPAGSPARLEFSAGTTCAINAIFGVFV